MIANFNTSDNFIELQDPENGKLVSKGVVEVKAINESGKTVYKRSKYVLSVLAKEDGCSININELIIIGEPSASNFYKAFYTPAEDVLSADNLTKGSKKKRRFYSTLKQGIQDELIRLMDEIQNTVNAG